MGQGTSREQRKTAENRDKGKAKDYALLSRSQDTGIRQEATLEARNYKTTKV